MRGRDQHADHDCNLGETVRLMVQRTRVWGWRRIRRLGSADNSCRDLCFSKRPDLMLVLYILVACFVRQDFVLTRPGYQQQTHLVDAEHLVRTISN